MSNLTKLEIKNFLLKKKGYLKKSPIEVAKAIWKNSDKHSLPKTQDDLKKELLTIRSTQHNLRLAKSLDEDTFLMDMYEKIVADKYRPKKRLFFDIEVSANIVFAWNIGHEVSISPDNIIQERAVICICYKWEGEDKVYSLSWDKGDDKEMLKKFAKIADSADEVITQNGDNFDIKWLRTRCLLHDIPISIKFNSIDTLKMARAGFKFNSNRLDYLGRFLGEGGKSHTSYDLWKDITLHNDKMAMKEMTDYCKNDVTLLEKVYKKLQKYSPTKKFKYKNV